MVRKAYDRAYYEMAGFRKVRHAQRDCKRLREVLSRKSRGRLLEIGCGQGRFLELASQHFEAWGVDASAYAVSRVPESLQPKVRVGDVEAMDLGRSCYDAVAAFNVLEHLHRPQSVLARVRRALRPGGLLIGSVPNRAKVVGRIFSEVSTVVDRTHVSVLTTKRWHQLFRDAGYKRIECFGEIPFGPNVCVYLRSPVWRHLALNLMFVCWK